MPGLLTLVMFVDDLFQLHKPVFPDATGLPSVVLLAVYGLAACAWAWANRRALADTELGVLVVAVAFFALWIVVKVGPGIPGQIPIASGAEALRHRRLGRLPHPDRLVDPPPVGPRPSCRRVPAVSRRRRRAGGRGRA